jgi:hypothetical protein
LFTFTGVVPAAGEPLRGPAEPSEEEAAIVGARWVMAFLIERPVVFREILDHRIDLIVGKIRSARDHLVHH